MYSKILIPVDFTEINRRCIEAAQALADEDTNIVLLHVIEALGNLDDPEDRQFYDRLEEKAGGEMAVLADLAETRGLTVANEVRIGKRIQTILQVAAEQEATLIIMSSHVPNPGRPLERFGSISHSVAALARIPVFLIK